MEIRTPRLLLRDYVASDVPAVFTYQSHPAYLRHYDGAPPTEADVRALVTMFRAWAEEVPRCRWQLAIVHDGALIGSCGVRCERAESTEAELGCELAPDSWGAGFAREACEAMLAFALHTVGIERVIAVTLPENIGAVRLARGLGLREVAPGRFERGRFREER